MKQNSNSIVTATTCENSFGRTYKYLLFALALILWSIGLVVQNDDRDGGVFPPGEGPEAEPALATLDLGSSRDFVAAIANLAPMLMMAAMPQAGPPGGGGR